MIVWTEESQLNELAKCHRKCFPNSLSSQLGLRYCKKFLGWYLDCAQGFLMHCEQNGQIQGYCGGIIVNGVLQTGSASSMFQHSFNDALLALVIRPWLLLHPEIQKKYRFVLRNIKYRFSPPKLPKSGLKKQKETPHTGLVVIGVNPEFQGKGIGSKLMQEFENHTLKVGIRHMRLTVKKNNLQAIKAYEKNGWKKASSDKIYWSMVKELNQVHENNSYK